MVNIGVLLLVIFLCVIEWKIPNRLMELRFKAVMFIRLLDANTSLWWQNCQRDTRGTPNLCLEINMTDVLGHLWRDFVYCYLFGVWCSKVGSIIARNLSHCAKICKTLTVWQIIGVTQWTFENWKLIINQSRFGTSCDTFLDNELLLWIQ